MVIIGIYAQFRNLKHSLVYTFAYFNHIRNILFNALRRIKFRYIHEYISEEKYEYKSNLIRFGTACSSTEHITAYQRVNKNKLCYRRESRALESASVTQDIPSEIFFISELPS